MNQKQAFKAGCFIQEHFLNWVWQNSRYCDTCIYQRVPQYYDQGLGETLVQHVNETPLFLSSKHHQQQGKVSFKNTIEHAGSLADRGEPTGTGRSQPLNSWPQGWNQSALWTSCNHSNTPATNHTHSHSGDRGLFKETSIYRNVYTTSGVVTHRISWHCSKWTFVPLQGSRGCVPLEEKFAHFKWINLVHLRE